MKTIPIILTFFLSAIPCVAQNFVLGHSPPANQAVNLVWANTWTNATETAGSGSPPSTVLNTTVSPAAGSLLVVGVAVYEGTAAITDNIGGATGWTKVGTTYIGSSAPPSFNSRLLDLWYKPNIPASITTVTLTTSASGTWNSGFVGIIIGEIAGASASPFTSGEVTNLAGVTTATPTAGPLTGATADSIYVALCETENFPLGPSTINASGTTGTWNLGSFVTFNPNNLPLNMVYKIVSATGSNQHVWNPGGSGSCVATMAIFHK